MTIPNALALLLGFTTPTYAQDAVTPGSAPDPLRPRHEAVRVHSGSVVLAATLVLPVREQSHPAVVLVSGAQDSVYAPSHPLVQRLARDEIAVLVLGKRGVGESTGNWRRASFEQRAEDDEYMHLNQEFAPGFLDMVSGWIIERTRTWEFSRDDR
jgi:hypothetical protein